MGTEFDAGKNEFGTLVAIPMMSRQKADKIPVG
jgi:hypothetical protein